VGPRDGTGIEIDDHSTYAESPRLTKLTKFQKFHNAESFPCSCRAPLGIRGTGVLADLLFDCKCR
jgi:hypothetical protein